MRITEEKWRTIQADIATAAVVFLNDIELAEILLKIKMREGCTDHTLALAAKVNPQIISKLILAAKKNRPRKISFATSYLLHQFISQYIDKDGCL